MQQPCLPTVQAGKPAAPSFRLASCRSGYWPAVWEGRRGEYESRHRWPEKQQVQRGQQVEQQGGLESAVGRPKRRLPGLPQYTYGLFGVGRRQHLHRFVACKRSRRAH